MPYITKRNRDFLDNQDCEAITAGELNYQFTMLARKYLDDSAGTYKVMNEIIGAFECAKLEFYRRIVVPYEEEKIRENGDLE